MTQSFVGDTRIVGWQLFAEWNRFVINPQSEISTHEFGFKKYWNFLYNLVHAGESNNAIAGTYMISNPNGQARLNSREPLANPR
jgi:hypothetical protein